jgi:hypothetical protein
VDVDNLFDNDDPMLLNLDDDNALKTTNNVDLDDSKATNYHVCFWLYLLLDVNVIVGGFF